MKNTTKQGLAAEEAARQFLTKKGHKVIASNVRCRFYELDIISTQHDYVILTEVKYRKNSSYGGGLSAISANKSKRLRNGFAVWLSENQQFEKLQPRIDVIAVDESGLIEHVENAIFSD